MNKSSYSSGPMAKKGGDMYSRAASSMIVGGDLGQASSPKKVKVPMCDGWKEVTMVKYGNRGYPAEAFNTKY